MGLYNLLKGVKAVGTEPVEVLGIHQTREGYYVYLCIGKVLIAQNIVLSEEKEGLICHIISKERIFEFPVVKNPGYVTFKKYI